METDINELIEWYSECFYPGLGIPKTCKDNLTEALHSGVQAFSNEIYEKFNGYVSDVLKDGISEESTLCAIDTICKEYVTKIGPVLAGFLGSLPCWSYDNILFSLKRPLEGLLMKSIYQKYDRYDNPGKFSAFGCPHNEYFLQDSIMGSQYDNPESSRTYYDTCIYCIMLNPNTDYKGTEWVQREGFIFTMDLTTQIFEKGYIDFVNGIILKGRIFDWVLNLPMMINHVSRVYMNGYNFAKLYHKNVHPKLIIAHNYVKPVQMEKEKQLEITVSANHFLYKPGASGYEEVKNHYESTCLDNNISD